MPVRNNHLLQKETENKYTLLPRTLVVPEKVNRHFPVLRATSSPLESFEGAANSNLVDVYLSIYLSIHLPIYLGYSDSIDSRKRETLI